MSKKLAQNHLKKYYSTVPKIRALEFIKPTQDNPIKVTTEKSVKVTTESLKKEFNKLPVIKYTSKYPNQTLEDVKLKLDNLYKNQDKSIDPEFLYEFAKENYGYSKEFTRKVVYGESKPYFEGKFGAEDCVLRWDNAIEDITVEENKVIWRDIEKKFNLLKERAKLFSDINSNFQRMEWDELEKVYGEDQIHESRLNYNEIITKELPEINVQELVDHVKDIVNPTFEKIKDVCLDYYPELERRFQQNNYIAPLLRLDSYGLPLYDFVEDFSIIDNYFPAYRDKIFEELDNDDFDTDVPKGTPTIDDVVESLHYNKFIETQEKHHKTFMENNTVSIGGNPRREEREANLKKLQQLVEERKQIESEVSQLKTKVDSIKEKKEEKIGVSGEIHDQKFNQIDYLYEMAESMGISREMCDPIFASKKSKKEIEEISKKVQEEYYKKKGIPIPTKHKKIFVF